jgi:hypothetical protein
MAQINKSKNPIILDCTLRNGSYVIDFQFTKEDTFNIASHLCESGFSYIEVGHGVGLGASKRGFDVAAATDEEYCQATVSAVGDKAKWGMFCILGPVNLDAKIKGMESYEFEKRPFPHPRSPEALKIQAQRWGVAVGCDFAEAFCIISLLS